MDRKCVRNSKLIAILCFAFSLAFLVINNLNYIKTIKDPVVVVLQLFEIHQNEDLIPKFHNCMQSILKWTSIPVVFHIITDGESLSTVRNSVERWHEHDSVVYFTIQNYEDLPTHIRQAIDTFKVSAHLNPDSYYNKASFFTTPLMHMILPQHINRAVIIDVDLQFRSDISALNHFFARMSGDVLFACAHEQQPTYFHMMTKLRDENNKKGTVYGQPYPIGIPGLNTGVMLIDTSKMRSSALYGRLLTNKHLFELREKYKMRNALGDQDYFTLLYFDQPKLFSILPCQWNRQLCTWWNNTLYTKIFDQFHNCKPPYHVLHGNCHTSLLYHA